eukprot:gene13169-14520_t
MFCSRCGQESRVGDNFCSKCGHNILQSGKAKQTLTFNDFKIQKEQDRSSRFEPNKRKFMANADTKQKKKKDQQVTINIGVMKLSDDRNLRRCRGKTLPIQVSVTAEKEQILELGLKKHSNHDKTIIAELKHVLLFPDGKLVDKVPGTNSEFVLNKYRNELGKNYNRLCLFIATEADFTISEAPRFEDFLDEEPLQENNQLNAFVDYDDDADLLIPSLLPSLQSCSYPGTSAGDLAICETSHNTVCPTSFDPKNEKMVECPTCFKFFPIKDIANHADICCEDWIGDVQVEGSENTDPTASTDFNDDIEHGREECELKSIMGRLLTSLPEKRVRLNIRRKYLWQDFKDIRSRGKIAPGDNIKIVFIGEPAIDDGGPKREFFADMMEIMKRKLFCNGKPVISTMAISNEEFIMAGQLMAMSIVQGGPAPSFMHMSLYHYMANLPLEIESNDENEPKYTEIALKISDATNEEQLHNIILTEEVLDILQDIGYTGIPSRETLKTAKNIVQSICIKSQLSAFLPQMLQLMEGLKCHGILSSLREFPTTWKPVFTECNNNVGLNGDEFLDEIVALFSSKQVEKEKELYVYKLFCDFILTLDNDGNLTTKDLVKWWTGSGTVPVLGFPKKFSVAFVHGCASNCRCRPTTSTCDILLKMPVHISGFEEMEEIMNSAVKDCCGFGLI